MTAEKILVVDDEPSVVEVIGLYLRKEGYQVLTAANGRDALQLIRDQKPKLVILDIMIPEMDGLKVLTTAREENSDTAVIMLTARRQEVDRIYGLELGADDYVTKPFSPAELVARVRAVLRRAGSSSAAETAAPKQTLRLGDGALIIDPAAYTVHVDGQHIELTATEFNLVLFMASHPNQVFTRDQLLETVWGFNDYLDPNTVTVHMRRVREKIERDPSKPQWLQTVWGVGYKFVTG